MIVMTIKPMIAFIGFFIFHVDSGVIEIIFPYYFNVAAKKNILPSFYFRKKVNLFEKKLNI